MDAAELTVRGTQRTLLMSCSEAPAATGRLGSTINVGLPLASDPASLVAAMQLFQH